jgi:hypothetical protein
MALPKHPPGRPMTLGNTSRESVRLSTQWYVDPGFERENPAKLIAPHQQVGAFHGPMDRRRDGSDRSRCCCSLVPFNSPKNI